MLESFIICWHGATLHRSDLWLAVSLPPEQFISNALLLCIEGGRARAEEGEAEEQREHVPSLVCYSGARVCPDSFQFGFKLRLQLCRLLCLFYFLFFCFSFCVLRS